MDITGRSHEPCLVHVTYVLQYYPATVSDTHLGIGTQASLAREAEAKSKALSIPQLQSSLRASQNDSFLRG